jgi:hypothetical protein
MYIAGKHPFISFRRREFGVATRFKQWLEEYGCCREAILFPPDSLCEENEVLTPRGILELVEDIGSRLMRADEFFIIDADDYAESYFTGAEMMQWCRRRNPVAHTVKVKGSEFEIYEGVFPTLEEGTKGLLSRISVNISKELRNPLIVSKGIFKSLELKNDEIILKPHIRSAPYP